MYSRSVRIALLIGTLTALLSAAAPATASTEILVAESETGVIFSSLQCKIFQYALDPDIRFASDEFLMLWTRVKVNAACVTESGRRVSFSDSDSMVFGTPELDWLSQTWRVNDTMIAERGEGTRVTMNPNLQVRTWHFGDETHVAFKVELWLVCPDAPLAQAVGCVPD